MLITSALRKLCLVSFALPVAVLLAGCHHVTYTEKVSTFTKGAVALETADQLHERVYLEKFTQIAPDEPAGWANLGLLEIRSVKLDKAAEDLKKAADLAPGNAAIQKMLGLLAQKQGDHQGAIDHYKKAVALDPDDIRTRYALEQELEGIGMGPNPAGLADAQQQLEAIVDRRPDNLYAILELIRDSATHGDTATFNKAIAQLKSRSQTFSPDALDQLKEVKAAGMGTSSRMAGIQAQRLNNVLKSNPAYQSSFIALRGNINTEGDPLDQFIKLPPIPDVPAAPDTGLTFTAQQLPGISGVKADWVGVAWLSGDSGPVALSADGHNVQIAGGKTLAFPGGPSATPPGPDGVLPLDVNYDLLTDFALAGRGGFKLYQQDKGGNFTDVTAQTTLPAPILNASYVGAWQADIEADGDIDIVLAPVSGPPVVLRNNGDSTWKAISPFAGVTDVRRFAWLDLDGDGNPDAIFVDAQGKLHVYMNQRAGLFRARPVPTGLDNVVAMTVGNVSAEGNLCLLALQANGKITRIADQGHGTNWDVAVVTQWGNPPAGMSLENARLFADDLDNNGGIDLVASAPSAYQVWLCDAKYAYAPLASPGSACVSAVVDMNGDGMLDLIGIDAGGQPVQMGGKGTKNYHWQEFRPRPDDQEIRRVRETGGGTGTKRIDSEGIGAEFELRAGLLYEKQEVLLPVVHFGLGTYPAMDALRIVWPNGDIRSEFSDDITLASQRIKPDHVVTAQHRLINSCPFLFTWNGKEMQFVTDCIWRSPLGLKINAIETAGVAQTEDWVKIRGDQLVPHNGLYDLRITAELWETHFFDHLSLLTVDHPTNTDIWVDERFAIPPPPHQVYLTSLPHPIASARDDRGNDVTDLVRRRDERYVDTFGRGEYQGVTRDHWLEVTLPEDAPPTGPLWLICSGWIHPTDSSINVALGQSHFPPPQGLSLETPDAQGHWHVARKGLGFPEGKVKTILLNLEGLFAPGAPRKLRLRTNLEIYWDAIQWASGLPQTPATIQHLGAKTAELNYRGFSVVRAKDASSPELPESYAHLEQQGQKWRDLIGYYTRYGDVRELLAKVDDRYVIMNAGDEMRLTFAAPPAPPAGMRRDYVLIGDGWVKDGNYNTTYSKTVLPLPLHDQHAYTVPPGRLEDDPAYKRHPQDWAIYHTRYVTPDLFARGLRPNRPVVASPAPQPLTLLSRKDK